jgi:hypothetical protein
VATSKLRIWGPVWRKLPSLYEWRRFAWESVSKLYYSARQMGVGCQSGSDRLYALFLRLPSDLLMPRVQILMPPRGVALGVVWCAAVVSGQSPSCSYTSPSKPGAPVSFNSLNNANGNPVFTPLGKALINPCQKVVLCDSLQAGSVCCLQVNDTAHPGTGNWVSCGTTWAFTTQMAEASMVVGMVISGGVDCGYVFAPNTKVSASIAFTCLAGSGTGKLSASKTGFLTPLKASPAAGGAGSAPGPGGSAAPAIDASQFVSTFRHPLSRPHREPSKLYHVGGVPCVPLTWHIRWVCCSVT